MGALCSMATLANDTCFACPSTKDKEYSLKSDDTGLDTWTRGSLGEQADVTVKDVFWGHIMQKGKCC